MMLQQVHKSRVLHPVGTPAHTEAVADARLSHAHENFYYYRQIMNPRMMIADKWFPLKLARELRTFYDTRIIYSSFSDRLSIRANLRIQRALDNGFYQLVFPQTKLSPRGVAGAQRNFDMLEIVDHDGYFRNTTVMGAITGEALDLGIIDDPIKSRAEANSELVREKTWSWLTDDVFARFDDKAALLLIGTRWHVDDPAGRLLTHYGDRVRVVKFPAIAEHDEYQGKTHKRLMRRKVNIFQLLLNLTGQREE